MLRSAREANVPAVQLLVSGRVQMVGYRAWCRRFASELQLVGWVRNLDDGRVEVFAEGEAAALERLVSGCGRGPPHAVVTGVERREHAPRALVRFDHLDDAPEPEDA